jgi:hypothetical protein
MKTLPCLLLAALALFAQTPVTPVQTAPLNIIHAATLGATSTVVLAGLPGTRIYVWSVTAVCVTPLSNVSPNLTINEGVMIALVSVPARSVAGESPVVRPLKWNPALTFGIGSNVTISANSSGDCTGTTRLMIQADQF